MYVRPHKWVKVNSMMRLKLFFTLFIKGQLVSHRKRINVFLSRKKQQHPVYRFRNIISIFAGNRSKA